MEWKDIRRQHMLATHYHALGPALGEVKYKTGSTVFFPIDSTDTHTV